MTNQEDKRVFPPQLITKTQAAELLGVSRGKFRRWFLEHPLPLVLLGRALMIDRRDLEPFLTPEKQCPVFLNPRPAPEPAKAQPPARPIPQQSIGVPPLGPCEPRPCFITTMVPIPTWH